MATEEQVTMLKKAFEEEIGRWKNQFVGVSEELEQLRKERAEEKQSTSNEQATQSKTDVLIESINKTVGEAKEGLDVMNDKWGKTLTRLIEKIVERDQYDRLNSILLHGFKFLPNLSDLEFIFFICKEMNRLFPSIRGQLRPYHIDDAHPLRTIKKGPTKVVIVKFSNRWVRHEIMRCQEDLVGTPFRVTEHLTFHTRQLLSSAGDLVGKHNVHTFKTVVYATYQSKRYAIRNIRDLQKLELLIHPPPPGVTHTIEDIPAIVNSTPNLIDEAPVHHDHYIINYGKLYESLFHDEYNQSEPLRGTYVVRGRPSRNGRGGRSGYSVRNRGSTY